MPGRQTNPWLVLCLVCIAQFMVVLDATIVNVALPSIQEDLDVAEADLQWIVNSYTLIFGGFLLLGGRAGDILGRKRLFLVGLVIFTVASLLNGLADSPGVLIVGRGLQGLGAAFVAPAALSILTTTFAEGPQRTKAMGVWAGIATGGAAIGLLLGGILTEYFSWPWIFFVNIPVGIAAFLLSLRYVPESRAAPEHRIFDVPGAVTVTAGLIALVYGIVNVQASGWTSPSTIGFGIVAAILLTAFVLIEQRQRAPLVRLDIFRVRTIRAANVSMLLVASGLFAMFFFNTLYVQRVLDFSPLQAGLAFLPVTVGIGIGAGLSQIGVKRLGIRTTSIVGMSIATVRDAAAADDGRERHVPRRRPPRADPDLDRDGAHLRAGDAARDEWRVERRRRPRVGALQHLPAGRRRARAGDPLDHCGQPDDQRARRPAGAADRGAGERSAPDRLPCGLPRRRRVLRRRDRRHGDAAEAARRRAGRHRPARDRARAPSATGARRARRRVRRRGAGRSSAPGRR